MTPNEWADFWYDEIGVNVIPAVTSTKKPLEKWKEDPRGNWGNISIPKQVFNEWKKQNKFKNGMAVICGYVYRGKHKGEYLSGYDIDNKLGLTEFVGSSTLEKISANTLVEQHKKNPIKAHFYFYSKEPVKQKAWNKSTDDTGNELPQIEVKTDSLLYCAGGIHSDGSLIDILDCKIPKTMEKKHLESVIEKIYMKYKIEYLFKEEKKISQEVKDGTAKTMGEGDNRSKFLLRHIDSLKINNPEFDEDDLFLLANKLNKTFKEPYPDSKVVSLIKQGKAWAEKILDENGKEITIESKALELLQIMDKKETLKELKLFALNQGEPKGDTILNEIIKQSQKKIKKGLTKTSKQFSNEQFEKIADYIKSQIDFLTIRESGKSHYYDKKREMYLPNGDTIIEEECQKLASDCKNETVSEVKGIIHRKDTMILAEELFSNNLVSCLSGVIDDNFDCNPHSSKYYVTKKLPFNYNLKSKNLKLWRHIIENIIEPKDINIFLEILWILISFKNIHKKCIIFYGESNTQKSTLMDIISWIVGEDNLSSENPSVFLKNGDRFSLHRMLGKSGNRAEEIGNITSAMWENFKTFIGSGRKTAEGKGSNDGRKWNPNEFLFMFATNSVKGLQEVIEDNSIINRIQFMMFKNIIKNPKGNWESDLFDGPEDKQENIDTIVNILIHRMKYQSKSSKNEILWSTNVETKEIIKETQPLYDKYFQEKEGRIVPDTTSEVSYKDIEEDFLDYTQWKSVSFMRLGTLLRQHGITDKRKGMRNVMYSGWKLPRHSSTRGENSSLDANTIQDES